MCPACRPRAPKYRSTQGTKKGWTVGGNHYPSENEERLVGHSVWKTPGNGLRRPKAMPCWEAGPQVQQERADRVKGPWAHREASRRKGQLFPLKLKRYIIRFLKCMWYMPNVKKKLQIIQKICDLRQPPLTIGWTPLKEVTFKDWKGLVRVYESASTAGTGKGWVLYSQA